MSERIYCYPESDVLIHKLDIHDLQTLQDAERDLTSRRLLQANIRPDPMPLPPGGIVQWAHVLF